ncbi:MULTISPECIES: hypothetical protein [unclassified Exiguobacterium]|uniref:hypothetical protein n=1 Tax=unclassified Exiguobacterium TaxID=2644629 RepID=UPI001BE5D247|nr:MULTISPECIES: hypothetical protein [unclassified Exiguobacterium]
MNHLKLSSFTIIDVIERQIHFVETNDVFEDLSVEDLHIGQLRNFQTGQLLALRAMLSDVMEMKENQFLEKYLTVMDDLNERYKAGEFSSHGQTDQLNGYTTAVINILSCIDPEFCFALEDHFEGLLY